MPDDIKHCPEKLAAYEAMERMHEDPMRATPLNFDTRCDFNLGPSCIVIERSKLGAVFLGATKEVEVCCKQQPYESHLEFP